MRIGLSKVTVEGIAYWLHKKLSWGRRYYSFDGDTWHESKRAAFELARREGTLHRVGEVKVRIVD